MKQSVNDLFKFFVNEDTISVWILTALIALIAGWSFAIWLIVSLGCATFIMLVASIMTMIGNALSVREAKKLIAKDKIK